MNMESLREWCHALLEDWELEGWKVTIGRWDARMRPDGSMIAGVTSDGKLFNEQPTIWIANRQPLSTVQHEVAHAILAGTDYAPHGREWADVALYIGCPREEVEADMNKPGITPVDSSKVK